MQEEKRNNKTERIFVRLTPEQKEEINKLAKEKNMTISELVIYSLNELKK